MPSRPRVPKASCVSSKTASSSPAAGDGSSLRDARFLLGLHPKTCAPCAIGSRRAPNKGFRSRKKQEDLAHATPPPCRALSSPPLRRRGPCRGAGKDRRNFFAPADLERRRRRRT